MLHKIKSVNAIKQPIKFVKTKTRVLSKLKNCIKITKSNYILGHLFFSIFRDKLALLVLRQRFSKVLLLIYIEFN